MQKKTEIMKSQKKFKYFKDENPIFFMDTFQYVNKTHYMISSSSYLYIGYMEKCSFNQVMTYPIKSHVTSFCLHEACLYFGLKNGSILYVTLEHVYNEIPFKLIESTDGKGILALSLVKNNFLKNIYVFTEDSFKMYGQIEGGFKYSKSVQIDSKIFKIVSKMTENLQLPCFMIWIKEYNGYPILLTIKELEELIQKKVQFSQFFSLREKVYYSDQKPLTKITCIDYDLGKMISSIGYSDGTIQVLKIEKAIDEKSFYILEPILCVSQKDKVNSVSIIENVNCPYIAYVTESLISGINIERLTNPFAKIKVEKDKQITCSKWTKNKHFIIGALPTDGNINKPKAYCIEQDCGEENE